MNRGAARTVELRANKIMEALIIVGITTPVPRVKCMRSLALSAANRLKFRFGQVVTVRYTAEIALAKITRGTNQGIVVLYE